MPVQSTDAIVIGGHDLAEADRIIVFYTKSAGKVRAVAPGVRRLRSRFGGSLQLFTAGRLVYYERPNKTLHKVNEFGVVRAHQRLREDLERIALASAAVEALSLGADEGEPSPDLYRLLDEGLDILEEAARPSVVLYGLWLHTLRLLGYLPELTACVRCRKRTAEPLFLSPAQGGLLCAACRPGVPEALRVSPDALGFLRGASASAPRLWDRIVLAPDTQDEVGQLLQAFLRQVLGHPLRSADFLDRL